MSQLIIITFVAESQTCQITLFLPTPMKYFTLTLCSYSYGYRGRDCRANLYLLPSGEAVYFIACVVVLYHLSNRTQRHYRKHTDCVRW